MKTLEDIKLAFLQMNRQEQNDLYYWLQGELSIYGEGVGSHPNIQGGTVCIKDTRIPVYILVNHKKTGRTDEQILQDYPSITAEQLQLAWAYADKHPTNISLDFCEHTRPLDDGEE